MLLAKATTKVSVTLESHSTHGTWLATALTSWPLVKGWSANMPSRSSASHGDDWRASPGDWHVQVRLARSALPRRRSPVLQRSIIQRDLTARSGPLSTSGRLWFDSEHDSHSPGPRRTTSDASGRSYPDFDLGRIAADVHGREIRGLQTVWGFENPMVPRASSIYRCCLTVSPTIPADKQRLAPS